MNQSGFTVRQKIPVQIANPLFHEGLRLMASVTRTFSQSRPLYVFLQALLRLRFGAAGAALD